MKYGFSQSSLGITGAIVGLSYSPSVSLGETSVSLAVLDQISGLRLSDAEHSWTSDA